MQLSFNKPARAVKARGRVGASRKLADLREGETAVIDRIDLPQELTVRLMELGFLPGTPVTAARCAPGGDPRVFRVDGAEIALRRETASHLTLKM
jgi:ferrous iron transport protein A